jgi:hypothetical protein
MTVFLPTTSGTALRMTVNTGKPMPVLASFWFRLLISSDHFFVFLSILTTFAPELSEFYGQN